MTHCVLPRHPERCGACGRRARQRRARASCRETPAATVAPASRHTRPDGRRTSRSRSPGRQATNALHSQRRGRGVVASRVNRSASVTIRRAAGRRAAPTARETRRRQKALAAMRERAIRRLPRRRSCPASRRGCGRRVTREEQAATVVALGRSVRGVSPFRPWGASSTTRFPRRACRAYERLVFRFVALRRFGERECAAYRSARADRRTVETRGCAPARVSPTAGKKARPSRGPRRSGGAPDAQRNAAAILRVRSGPTPLHSAERCVDGVGCAPLARGHASCHDRKFVDLDAHGPASPESALASRRCTVPCARRSRGLLGLGTSILYSHRLRCCGHRGAEPPAGGRTIRRDGRRRSKVRSLRAIGPGRRLDPFLHGDAERRRQWLLRRLVGPCQLAADHHHPR